MHTTAPFKTCMYIPKFLSTLMQKHMTTYCMYALRHGVSRCIQLALCLAFLNSTPALASGREALMHFVTQVQTAKGQFEQKQIATKPQPATTNGARIATRPPITMSPPEQVLQGHFVFKRPGQFIWEVTKPYEQVLQADGRDFYVYDKDLQQVTHRLVDEAMNGSSAAILFGRADLERTFTLRDEGVVRGIDWLELRPKQQDAAFERIRIGFRSNMLHAMELHDAFGNVTYLTFHHLEINPSLAKDQFKFTLPAEAELVEG